MPIDLPASADRRQVAPPGIATDWADVFELDFFAPDASFGGFVTMGLYPGAKRGWFWAAVVGDDRQLVLVVDDELPLPAAPHLEVRSSGIWTDFIPQIPLEHFTVGLEAFGVGLDDPNDVFDGLRGDLTPIGFDMEWETEGDMWPIDPTGFEVPCRAHGEILLGHEEFDFDGLGTRRRWWGPDDRRAAPGMRLSGWWHDGASFGAACELLDRASPEVFVVEATDIATSPLTLVVKAVAPLPIIRPGHDEVGQRWRMLCRVEAGDKVGVAWLDLQ